MPCTHSFILPYIHDRKAYMYIYGIFVVVVVSIVVVVCFVFGLSFLINYALQFKLSTSFSSKLGGCFVVFSFFSMNRRILFSCMSALHHCVSLVTLLLPEGMDTLQWCIFGLPSFPLYTILLFWLVLLTSL